MSATRLIFEYVGDEVRLVSRQGVRMIVPPSPAGSNLGFGLVAEVRATDGSVLHRAAVPGVMEPHQEIFSGDPEGSIQRVPVERPQGAFTVVIPDCGAADHIALLAGHAIRAGSALAAEGLRELIRVPLRPEEGAALP